MSLVDLPRQPYHVGGQRKMEAPAEWTKLFLLFLAELLESGTEGRNLYQGFMLARRARRLEHLAGLLNTRQRLCTPVWNQKTGRKSDDDASDRIHRFLSRIREPKPLTFGASHSAPRLTGIYWAPTDGLSNERRMFYTGIKES